MTAVFDARRCELGEGPLWHPQREQLFWFDILTNRMLSRHDDDLLEWQFAENVSAAGWVDLDTLVIASESGLFRYNLVTGAQRVICALEDEKPNLRSNDGRADQQGGFWIGTMGKKAEAGLGAIWRYHKGVLRKLFPGISIPNSISFTPDGRTAHFSDSATRQVMRVALDTAGWPLGTPQVCLDLGPDGGEPDGAVVDDAGNLWLAEWGMARVCCYAPDGTRLHVVPTGAAQTSCPAFGGADLSTLFVTSALQGMDAAARAAEPQGGMTFSVSVPARGQAENRVIL